MFERIRDLIAHHLELSPALITMDTNVMEDLGADSLDVAELVMTLEEEFGIFITDEQASEMTTVGDIVRYLDTL